MLIGFLLVLQIIVCVALVGVILLQRSEGGALGMGGGGGGFMTARGAGNLLTRTTGFLAAIFFVLSIGLTILGNFQRNQSITNKVTANDVTSLTQTSAPPSAPASAPKAPSLSDLGQPVLTPAPAQASKKSSSQGPAIPSGASSFPTFGPTSTPASTPEPSSK